MTETEFISEWVGTPWVERGHTKHGIDCWALVVRYYADVLGIQLRDDYAPDIASGFTAEESKWVPCDKQGGVAFMCFDQAGEPKHVGVVVGDGRMILHARLPSVSCNRIEAMRHYKIKYYTYKGDQ